MHRYRLEHRRAKLAQPFDLAVKKQTAVSHSSTEAEVIALDAGLRTEGLPLLHLWECVLETMYPDVYAGDTNEKCPKQVFSANVLNVSKNEKSGQRRGDAVPGG